MATHMPFDSYSHPIFQQYHPSAQLDFTASDQFFELQQQQQHDADLSNDLLNGYATAVDSGTGSSDSPLSSSNASASTNALPSAGPVGQNPLHNNHSPLDGSPFFDPQATGHPYPHLWMDAGADYGVNCGALPTDGNFDLDASVMTGLDFTGLLAGEKFPGFVDSNLVDTMPTPTSLTTPLFQPQFSQSSHPPSPAASFGASHLQTHSMHPDGHSPVFPLPMWQHPPGSVSHSPQPSVRSRLSHSSPRSSNAEFEEEREKAKCPYPDCGKTFKDLKAHMLTHQNERPEKCPIVSCEFHKRGFARKYDRNRHLVTTHYKSTIVCGFCPGPGTPSEKTFNRTDVFKRHLVSVHGVEQNPPNSRKKSPVSSGRASPSQSNQSKGKCSTCGCYFSNAQDLFEHLDDCVLRVVQQIEPSEANNERLLRSVAEDQDVKNTMQRHALLDRGQPEPLQEEADDNDDFDDFEEVRSDKTGKNGRGRIKSFKEGHSLLNGRATADGRISKPSANNPSGRARGGVTFSQGGMPMQVGKSRKRRKHYPQSWGCSADKMKMKKRVLCVFDGQRRLWKDDMMLGNDYEVRMKLGDGEHWVTDLDVETLKRAEGFHMATDEERGPWVPTNYPGNVNVDELLA